ncbi:nuclear condensing complex subunit [Crassisporium funariophilum]|nr:nuclear condensing complex subunit [Crassisporium funariophilum]
MPARAAQASHDSSPQLLASNISRIFQQAQDSSTNHQKNYVALHKIHAQLAQHTESLQKGKLFKMIGERMFEDTFLSLLMQALSLKKGMRTADCIVKFVAGYTKFVNEKAAEDRNLDEDEDDDNPTTASRFTARLLKHLLKGFVAKDKNVRFRVLQSVAEMISHLGEIDEDIYASLRTALIERVSDKEATVRYQAVISLSKLCGSENLSELEEGESILEILIDTLAHDPSPEVRKAVLVNFPVTVETLPAILDRTRDTDAIIRKVVYNAVLAKHTTQGEEGEKETLGITHPRVLSIAQRELIVKNGLGDREPAVRAAAASLITTWVHEGQSGVVSLLSLFDLGQGTVAADALMSVFTTDVAIFNDFEFGDQYWTTLTPETAFLARVFVEHCKATKDETRLEATLPVVTEIAFHIQQAYSLLSEFPGNHVNLEDDNEFARREDEKIDRELVLAELLKLAVNLDYSDEIGRRKTFQLVRDILRSENLPEVLVAPCLDVLRKLSTSERDLIRVVVETVQEIRDSVYGDNEDEMEDASRGPDEDSSFNETPKKPRPARNPVEDMSPEQKVRVDQVDLRSLSLCIGMLERVDGTFEENIMLDGILKELIIPSVQRKDIAFRESGLKCLGLCCLIAKRLALQSINLFMNQIPSSPTSIKMILLQILFDIFMKHETEMFKNQGNNLEALTDFLMHHIKEEQDPKAKAILCEGTAKLVLSGMITDVNVIKNLIKTYLSPLTADNQELRQCLAFFLQMYSYSSPSNQRRMREIFIHVFLDVSEDRKEAGKSDEEPDMVSSAQVAAMFLDWTDPLRLSHAIGQQVGNGVDEAVQLDMAEDVLRTLFEKDLKEDKRVLCQLLNRLYIPDVVDDYKIRSVKLLIDHLRTRRPLRDSVCNTALTKFDTTIIKKFEEQLKHSTEEEFRKLEELNELFEFLDSIIPLDDDEIIDLDAPRKKGRKRLAHSSFSIGTRGLHCTFQAL